MKRSPLPPRKKRIAPESAKRKKERPERARIRDEAARHGVACMARDLVPEVRCWGPTDYDEIIPRGVRPGGHLEQENVQPLCRAHHQWKDANPREAHDRGIRKWSWE